MADAFTQMLDDEADVSAAVSVSHSHSPSFDSETAPSSSKMVESSTQMDDENEDSDDENEDNDDENEDNDDENEDNNGSVAVSVSHSRMNSYTSEKDAPPSKMVESSTQMEDDAASSARDSLAGETPLSEREQRDFDSPSPTSYAVVESSTRVEEDAASPDSDSMAGETPLSERDQRDSVSPSPISDAMVELFTRMEEDAASPDSDSMAGETPLSERGQRDSVSPSPTSDAVLGSSTPTEEDAASLDRDSIAGETPLSEREQLESVSPSPTSDAVLESSTPIEEDAPSLDRDGMAGEPPLSEGESQMADSSTPMEEDAPSPVGGPMVADPEMTSADYFLFDAASPSSDSAAGETPLSERERSDFDSPSPTSDAGISNDEVPFDLPASDPIAKVLLSLVPEAIGQTQEDYHEEDDDVTLYAQQPGRSGVVSPAAAWIGSLAGTPKQTPPPMTPASETASTRPSSSYYTATPNTPLAKESRPPSREDDDYGFATPMDFGTPMSQVEPQPEFNWSLPMPSIGSVVTASGPPTPKASTPSSNVPTSLTIRPFSDGSIQSGGSGPSTASLEIDSPHRAESVQSDEQSPATPPNDDSSFSGLAGSFMDKGDLSPRIGTDNDSDPDSEKLRRPWQPMRTVSQQGSNDPSP
jgi:hypothetical protein